MARKSAPEVERDDDNFTVDESESLLHAKNIQASADEQTSSKGSIVAVSIDDSADNGCE